MRLAIKVLFAAWCGSLGIVLVSVAAWLLDVPVSRFFTASVRAEGEKPIPPAVGAGMVH